MSKDEMFLLVVWTLFVSLIGLIFWVLFVDEEDGNGDD